jgi:cytochrome oxidase Cu insertion factor (SCO1/SenC/PrrC family)
MVLRVPDTALVDQHGRTVHLYSDLVKGRKSVVISTMFTTCGTICPIVGVRMSGLQRSLGACSHDEYSLISISVDPAVDTPERLREWGQKFGAGPCWRLLTGPKVDVDAALRSLRLLPPDKVSHSPSALIGHDGAGDWTLCNVLTSQENLLRIVRQNMISSSAKDPKI